MSGYKPRTAQRWKKSMRDFQRANVREVRLFTAQLSSDCQWAMENNGRIFPIEQAPKLPAPGCKHCNCLLHAYLGPPPTEEQQRAAEAALKEMGISIRISKVG